MTKQTIGLLLLTGSLALGCGKPSEPPPGAPTEAPQAPQIEGVEEEAEESAPENAEE